MHKLLLAGLGTALLAVPCAADAHVEVRGTVAASAFTTGQFANVNGGDPVVVSFDVTTPGLVFTPGHFTLYDIVQSSFDIDINGPTGLTFSPGEIARLKLFNDNASLGGDDRFEVDLPLLTGGHFLQCFFSAIPTFFSSDDITLAAGTHMISPGSVTAETFSLAIPLVPFSWMDINFDSLTITVTGAPVYPDSCNGDGGNQMGCTNCPCANNAPAGTVGGCLNSAGTAARLEASGSSSVSIPSGSTSDLRFGLTGAPGNAFCILNSGDAVAPGNMANPCFGLDSGAQATAFDGLRCAIMNTRRHGGRSANALGEVGTSVNPWGGEGGPPIGIAKAGAGFAAGQTRYFQVVNRDDALLVCMRGLNTSQAVEVTFTP